MNHRSHARAPTRRRRFLHRTLLLLFVSAVSVATQAEIIENMPDVIVCSVKDPTGTLAWERLVYYVSAHMTNGETLFKTLTSDPVVLLVSAGGIIRGPNLADCDGRSIESLREEGRAFDITAPQAEPPSPE